MTKLDEVIDQTRQVLTSMERHKAENAALGFKEVRVKIIEKKAIEAITNAIDSIADVERLLAEADKLSDAGQMNEGRITICYQVRHDLEQIGDELTDAPNIRAGDVVPEELRAALFHVHDLACQTARGGQREVDYGFDLDPMPF